MSPTITQLIDKTAVANPEQVTAAFVWLELKVLCVLLYLIVFAIDYFVKPEKL